MLERFGNDMEAIRVKNLAVSYDDVDVIKDMTLTVPKGKVTVVVGSNGCGKSTFLKTVARILRPRAGEIFINGKNLKLQKPKMIAKQVAFLPQSPKCPDTITVRELVAYGRFPYQSAMGGMSRHDRDMVDWAIKETGLTDFAGRMVESLSGGQRQRAWIAMTLAQETDMIMLDEPTTYLDLAHQLEVLQLLHRLNREKQYTIVMVLHELNQACRFADHMIGMKKGSVICQGTPLEAITEESLREIYGIDAVLLRSHKGYPICTDFELVGGLKKGSGSKLPDAL